MGEAFRVIRNTGGFLIKAITFIDTETTGLDSSVAEVIEVAAIRVEGGNERVFHTLIRPEHIHTAHPKALEINGYAAAPERWEDAPTMKEVGVDLLAFLKGSALCGHNVSFDEEMINSNLKRAGFQKRVPYHKVDTVTLAHEHLTPLGLPRLGLDPIRDFLGWGKEGAHTALKDARDTQRLYNLTCRMGWKGKTRLRLYLWKRRILPFSPHTLA